MSETQPLHIMATDEAQTKTFMDRVEAKRRGAQVPLEKDACSALSIYLMKADGTLWTIRRSYRVLEDGRRHEVVVPYRQVRDMHREYPYDVVLCLCCGAQTRDIEKLKHKQGKSV